MAEDSVLKGQLDGIRKQLEDIRADALARKSMDLNVYWWIVISALIGVLGNWMAMFYVHTGVAGDILGAGAFWDFSFRFGSDACASYG